MNRMERIKSRLFNLEFYTKKEWWGEDKTILDDPGVRKESVMIRKAIAIAYVMKNMPVELKDDELIVGIPTMASIGFGKVFPEYALPEEKEEAAKSAFTTKSPWGHHPPRYDKLLGGGLRGFMNEIYGQVEKERGKKEPEQSRLDFFRAMLITLDGAQELANRYADLTFKAAVTEKNARRRDELLEISRICRKVPMNPAETLQEALQSFWFVFIAMHSTLEYLPTGRSDQYLYPYYKADIESGRITKERAEELVGSWLAKYSERVQLDPEHWELHMTADEQGDGGNPDDMPGSFVMENDEGYNYGTSANHWLINMILGGLKPDGTDGTNDMTYLILRQWAYLEPVCPVLSVRFHNGTPQELYDACSRILRRGSGEPAIYNDEVVIEGLTKMGIPIEDARDYSNDGCWEVLIPGKSYFSYFHVEMLQILEYVMQHGKSLARGTVEGPDYGDLTQYGTFDDFYAAIYRLMEFQVERILRNKIDYHLERAKIAPSPFLSAMMDDCVANGLDMSEDGARYNIYSLIITGLANFADSMAAIKMMVFEEKKITLQELADALADNFEGREPLRRMLLNRVPKFGNDNAYVDDLAVRIMEDCYATVMKKSRERDLGKMKICCGIGTFENYARFGHNIGATPDGRLSQESISSNFSPSLGGDVNGPTSAIKSITKAELFKFVTGCPLDLQINSNEVEGEAGLNRVSGLIRAFRDLGGLLLTITGVSDDMLIAAQREPEKNKGLRVRMGGLSAYFIALSKEQQDIMIKRVKHSV